MSDSGRRMGDCEHGNRKKDCRMCEHVAHATPYYQIEWLCPAKNSISGQPYWTLIENGKRFDSESSAQRAIERVRTTIEGELRIIRVAPVSHDIADDQRAKFQNYVDKNTARAVFWWMACLAGEASSQGRDITTQLWSIARQCDFCDIRESFVQREAPEFVRQRFSNLFKLLDERAIKENS